MIDFDVVMQRIGPFGNYQKLRFGLLNIAVMVLYQYPIYGLIFISYTPPHTCIAFSNADGHTIFLNRTNLAPIEISEASAGEMVASAVQAAADECSVTINNGSSFLCVKWSYERAHPSEQSIVSEWDLVCDRAWIVTIIQTLSNIATALGALVFSLLQDFLGRRPGFFVTVLVCVIPGVALSFTQDQTTFTVLRSIQATMITAGWQFPYIHSLEMVGPDQRTFVTSVMIAIFSLGATSVGFVAWLFPNWRVLCRVTSLPFAAFLGYWFILDESPRWLLTKRKTKELTELCHKIAAANGCPIADEEIDSLLLVPMREAAARADALDHVSSTAPLMEIASDTSFVYQLTPRGSSTDIPDDLVSFSPTGKTVENKSSEKRPSLIQEVFIRSEKRTSSIGSDVKSKTKPKKQKDAGVLDLFANPNIGAKTAIIMFLYIVNAIVYTGLAFNVENLAGNRFVNFAMLMIMELPAGIAINFILERFGRILPMAVMMTAGGAAAVVTSVIPANLPLLIGLMAAASKFGISGSFAILCQLTSELYPTQLRGTGTGLGGFTGSLSMAAVPFIVFSAQASRTLPMIIMGLMSVSGGISVLFLPETLNTVLPETVSDAVLTKVGLSTAWSNIKLQALMSALARGKEKDAEGKGVNEDECTAAAQPLTDQDSGLDLALGGTPGESSLGDNYPVAQVLPPIITPGTPITYAYHYEI